MLLFQKISAMCFSCQANLSIVLWGALKSWTTLPSTRSSICSQRWFRPWSTSFAIAPYFHRKDYVAKLPAELLSPSTAYTENARKIASQASRPEKGMGYHEEWQAENDGCRFHPRQSCSLCRLQLGVSLCLFGELISAVLQMDLMVKWHPVHLHWIID